MFSLQAILGGKDKTLTLLQEGSQAAVQAAKAANKMAQGNEQTKRDALMANIVAARKREKEIEAKLAKELINRFVTAFDSEDIEATSSALYKIPKTIEKFADRFLLVADELEGVDFSRRTAILEICTETVAHMVGELKNGFDINSIRKSQDNLQALEGEADKLMLEPYRDLYVDKGNPTRAFLAKTLFEIIEQAIDNCRDAGNIIYSVVLKNS